VCPNLGNIATEAARVVTLGEYSGKARDAAAYIRESIVDPNAYIVPGTSHVTAGGSSWWLLEGSVSCRSGTATLSNAGDKQTKVSITTQGGGADAQPTHIHKGTCAKTYVFCGDIKC
jgi:hypothetical protein